MLIETNKYPYSIVSSDIKVSAIPIYEIERSEPHDGQFFWSYTITIENKGKDTVQLQSRSWVITDDQGKQIKVSGEGVLGVKPIIEPGDTFTYQSGTHLDRPSGIMQGRYEIWNDKGQKFHIAIPAFSLDLPDIEKQIN